jgi:phosphatidylserine synthase
MFHNFKLPDVFTCGALIAAILSINLSISGYYGWALLLLPVAALFDTLDGFAARSMGRTDKFGVQLDSLVDMVAYGIALSVFWLAASHGTWIDHLAVTLFGLAVAIRLAAFNIKEAGEPYRGLPSGWNAWVFPIAYFLGLTPIFPALFILMAALMVAPVNIPKLVYRMEQGKIAIRFQKT